MNRTCSLCQKGTTIGRNRSHAQNRTQRKFKANIHKVTLNLGKDQKLGGYFCSKCLKGLKREMKQKAAVTA